MHKRNKHIKTLELERERGGEREKQDVFCLYSYFKIALIAIENTMLCTALTLVCVRVCVSYK